MWGWGYRVQPAAQMVIATEGNIIDGFVIAMTIPGMNMFNRRRLQERETQEIKNDKRRLSSTSVEDVIG